MDGKLLARRYGKHVIALALAAFIALLPAGETFAASDYTYIKSVSITADIDLVAGEALPELETGYSGDECEVMVPSNDKYFISSAKWSNSTNDAKLGMTYTFKVTLESDGNYRFSGSYSSSKVKVKGADFISASRSSSTKLIVTLRSRRTKGDLEEPYDACWESTSMGSSNLGIARWDTVEDAAYDLSLYRGSRLVKSINNLHSSTYNLYPFMTQKGTYTFKVRSVPASDDISKYAKHSEWAESDELYLEDGYVSDGSGETAGGSSEYTPMPDSDKVGWIQDNDKWFFRYPNGEYARDGWADIGGCRYLFDQSGVMLTGWQQRDGAYYSLRDSGEMRTGWHQENDVWYYLNPDGSMATGWIQIAENVYYMNSDGKMVTGWQEIEDKTYYFYPDGHKAVNEVVDGLFYVDMNGVWEMGR